MSLATEMQRYQYNDFIQRRNKQRTCLQHTLYKGMLCFNHTLFPLLFNYILLATQWVGCCEVNHEPCLASPSLADVPINVQCWGFCMCHSVTAWIDLVKGNLDPVEIIPYFNMNTVWGVYKMSASWINCAFIIFYGDNAGNVQQCGLSGKWVR